MVAFTGLKQHFNPANKYNWFRYGGKIKVPSVADFEVSGRAPYIYKKLANHRDPIGLMVANLLNQSGVWVGSLNDSEAEEIYNKWLMRQESFTYMFTKDINSLPPRLDDSLAVPTGSHPLLLRRLMGGHFGMDSFCAMQKALNFFPYWDSSIEEPVIWPEWRTKALMYMPFLEIDMEKIQHTLTCRFPERLEVDS
jgi:hypothetical protein